MLTAVNQTLSAFRNDPLYLLMEVIGYDLSGNLPSLAVKLYPDAPGPPLLLLAPTVIPGADGIRSVSVTYDDDDVPTTLLEAIASKTVISALPAAPVAGADVTLAYDLQWTPPLAGTGLSPVEETVLFGDFIIKGSVND